MEPLIGSNDRRESRVGQSSLHRNMNSTHFVGGRETLCSCAVHVGCCLAKEAQAWKRSCCGTLLRRNPKYHPWSYAVAPVASYPSSFWKPWTQTSPSASAAEVASGRAMVNPHPHDHVGLVPGKAEWRWRVHQKDWSCFFAQPKQIIYVENWLWHLVCNPILRLEKNQSMTTNASFG